MLLKNKVAVIYGAGGAIGSTVAKLFSKEGAHVFLAGRTEAKLEELAHEISGKGGKVSYAAVDALEKESVEIHLSGIIKETGRIDISLNLIGLGDVQGKSLSEMMYVEFAIPIYNAMTTHFITATAAARYMVKKGAGVILAVTANAAVKPFLSIGGFGVACAAIEGFCRQLALETGKHGVRVVCIRSSGSPDAPGVDAVFNQHAMNAGISRKAFDERIAERTMLKRLPRLEEVANALLLMASDRASAITAAVTNVTCGEIAE
jgi:3-oxoacyl-[acyl-carrier protein] reductase